MYVYVWQLHGCDEQQAVTMQSKGVSAVRTQPQQHKQQQQHQQILGNWNKVVASELRCNNVGWSMSSEADAVVVTSDEVYKNLRFFTFILLFLVWAFLYTFQYCYFCCCCCCCSNNLYRLSVITVRRFSLPHASFYTINTRFCCCCYFYSCHNYSSGGWGVLLTLFLVVIESCCCVQCVDMDI